MFIKTSCSINTSTMLPHNHLRSHKDTRGSNAPQNTPPGSHLTAPRRGRRRPHIRTPGWGSPRSPAESSGGERWARGAPTSRGGGGCWGAPPLAGFVPQGGIRASKISAQVPRAWPGRFGTGQIWGGACKNSAPRPQQHRDKAWAGPGLDPPSPGSVCCVQSPPPVLSPPPWLKNRGRFGARAPMGSADPAPSPSPPQILGCPGWGVKGGGGAADPSPPAAPEELERETRRRRRGGVGTRLGNTREINNNKNNKN